MSPLVMLLAFMLPMLRAATQILNEADLYTLFPTDPVGDVLNVTQCYCQSSDPLSPNATFGYYYLFDYYNYHLNHTYSIEATCTSSAPDNSNGTKPSNCMDGISKHKKICQDYADGNKFCYKFKEDINNWEHSTPSESEYRFNGQKRGVPALASDILTEDDLTDNCGFFCNEKLGGLMTFETSSSLIPGIGPVTNSIVSYTDLDDMCSNCAA